MTEQDIRAEAEADYANQLRADHAAEKHVGEPNGDCPECQEASDAN